MSSDDEIKAALKAMGLGRSVLPIHVRMLLKQFGTQPTDNTGAVVAFEDVAISELPDAGEYERGYNKAIALMRARLETGYGTEPITGSAAMARPARRSK